MVVDLITILHGYGVYTVDAIRQSMSSKGVTATGKTARSLRYEVSVAGHKTILKVSGKPFFKVIETGRRATPEYKQPSYEFVQSIKNWVKARGIQESAAFSIAKSIHKKGTKGTPGVITSVINETLTQKITKDALTQFAQMYLQNAVKMYAGNSN